MRLFSSIARRRLHGLHLARHPAMRHAVEGKGHQACMEGTRSARVGAFACLVLAGRAAPATPPEPVNDAMTPPPHVRPERPVRALVEEAARRSPVIRHPIEQLEALDVTVYLRARVRAIRSGGTGRADGGGRGPTVPDDRDRMRAAGVHADGDAGHELFTRSKSRASRRSSMFGRSRRSMCGPV